MVSLSSQQAFLAMVSFLEAYYERTKAGDIGDLLAQLVVSPDGETADPAACEDWQQAVARVTTGTTGDQ